MQWNLFVVLPVILIATCKNVATAQDFGEDPKSCFLESVKYDWENLNYYELLGFDKIKSPEEVDSKAIRKNYRKQAQQWHPDKIRANATLTMDEINARFAKIGDAYRTLNDKDTRNIYNRFLKNCEFIRGQGAAYSSHQQSHHRHVSRSRTHSNDKQQRRSQYRAPTSIQKQKEILIDPMTGRKILRETAYEEYYTENYFRVTIQDYDSYQRPLSPYPQVVEEGQIYSSSQHESHYHQQQRQHQGAAETDTLVEGDVLHPSQALYSRNQQYRAHLENCQLTVEAKRQTEFGPEIEIVWKSPNEVPHHWMIQTECFLALEDGQLMIAGGNGQIWWFSNPDEDDNFEFGHSPMYRARLENDGILVVYRIDRLDETKETCIYATGIFGCLRLRSKIGRTTQSVKAKLSVVWATLRQKGTHFAGGEEEDFLSRIKKFARDLLDALHQHRSDTDGFFFKMTEFSEEKLRDLFEAFGQDHNDFEKGILQKLTKLNNARKRVESSLSERSLRLVRDVKSWWQKQQQRY